MPLKDDLLWRYATKLFDPTKKIPDADLQDLLDSLLYAPSSYGLQPWHFLVVVDEEKRKELRPFAWNQPQITDASHLIVLCARTDMDEAYIQRFTEKIAEMRGVELESLEDYKQMMLNKVLEKSKEERQDWMKRQVYLALGFLMSACMEKHIDSCPIEGFEPDKFDELLSLKEKGWTATVVCALGYRSQEDKYAQAPKARWDADEVLEVL